MDLPFRTLHARPARLSDPSCDFSSGRLKQIIRTPDEALSWSEFRDIFRVGIPAGTYEETVYFLPIALHDMRLRPRDSLEFMSGVCSFIADNIRRLEADSLSLPTMQAITAVLRAWTSRFVVTHYDADACRKKGWTIDHDDIVENSQEVSELVADLWRYPAFPDLADRFIEDLARPQHDETRSAWFLEYARATLQGYATWPGDLNMVPTKSSRMIPRLIQDRSLLQQHYGLVIDGIGAATPSPTYWHDLRSALGLNSVAQQRAVP